jgi:pyruvate,orthophosphate dikinase
LEKLGLKNIPYMYGTMIETPRAALKADSMAMVADFFSFGTNDLTRCLSVSLETISVDSYQNI